MMHNFIDNFKQKIETSHDLHDHLDELAEHL